MSLSKSHRASWVDFYEMVDSLPSRMLIHQLFFLFPRNHTTTECHKPVDVFLTFCKSQFFDHVLSIFFSPFSSFSPLGFSFSTLLLFKKCFHFECLSSWECKSYRQRFDFNWERWWIWSVKFRLLVWAICLKYPKSGSICFLICLSPSIFVIYFDYGAALFEWILIIICGDQYF